MQTTVFALVFALFARIAFAVPPACLLHAVNTADEPGDMSAVCGDGATDIQAYMASNCGGSEDVAQKAFIATCSAAGTAVDAYTATSNSTMTSTRSTSATSTSTSKSVTLTGSARSSGTASGSASETETETDDESDTVSGSTSASASASRTGTAILSTGGANIYRRDGMGAVGAAAIALVGAVAAL